MDTPDPLSLMSDEELQQVLEALNAGNRNSLLEQQMAQAEHLRRGSGQRYSTGGGAALGGLSDAIRNVQGTFQQKDIRGQQEALMKLLEDPRRVVRPQAGQPGLGMGAGDTLLPFGLG